MDQYELIRTSHRVYGWSIRKIARELGHHRKTVRKALKGLEPKYRRSKSPPSPVMDEVSEVVGKWLREDETAPKKQRHTARRIHRRLLEEQKFEGSESTVRRWVRRWKAKRGKGRIEAVVPLDPEAAREAEVDWGTVWVEINGERSPVKLFAMRSRFSGRPFLRAYPWERQEMLFDAHMRAFEHYQGVHPAIVYDNMSTAVKRIVRGGKRVEQERFASFRSWYTFEARFCNPATPREKGGVEGLIGFAARNFLTPVPRVGDFGELNDLLLRRCLEYDERRIAGREDGRTVGERHEAEKENLLPLPDRPFENVKPVRVRVDRYQTARVDRNRYSVPRELTGRWIWAHVGCETVSLYCDDRLAAEHERVFSNGKWQLSPLHYLALLEERAGAFEAARPIRQWRAEWPQDYEILLESLRRRRGHNRGTREFVRTLRLHEKHPGRLVRECVAEAVRLGCADYESIRCLIHGLENEPLATEALPAGLIPGVTDRRVPEPELGRFDALLLEGGAS